MWEPRSASAMGEFLLLWIPQGQHHHLVTVHPHYFQCPLSLSASSKQDLQDHLQGGNGGEEDDKKVSRVLSQERGASYLWLSWNISVIWKYLLSVNMFAWKNTKAASFWIIAHSLLLLMCLTKLKIRMSDPPTLEEHCLSTWRLCPALKEITIFIYVSTTRITKKKRETSIGNRLEKSKTSTNHSSAYHWLTIH